MPRNCHEAGSVEANGLSALNTAILKMTLETTTINNQPTRSISRTLQLIFLLWICLKIGGCLLMVPGPWGPKVGGKLPNGTEVYFQTRPVGGETDDRLTVVAPNATAQQFWVDRTHAGFEHVTLKYAHGGNQLWVEADGKVGASIDVKTGDFRAELDPQHAWATYGGGKTLDAGRTGSIIWLLGPW